MTFFQPFINSSKYLTDNKGMHTLKACLPLFCLLFLSSACLKEGKVVVDDLSNIKAQVFKVENQNDKLIIIGKNLNATRKIQLKGTSIDNEMVIEAQSDSKIVAGLSQALTLTVSAMYELVLSNAYGQSSYQLSFELQDGQVTTVKLADGAVTGQKISDMGALSGQVLKFNGTTWNPADLNSLVYAGTWNASSATAPSTSPMGGDFWIVDTDGDVDLGDGNGLRQWRVGDWIVYNSFTSQWDQVISSQSVVSFNGRAGEVTAQTNDYTWQQINKALAPIDDLSDVDTSTVAPAVGTVLKWDGLNWTPQLDENGGGDITSVNAGTGLLGGASSGDATLSVDVGTGASQIPQLDASGLLLSTIIPGLDTSKITTGVMATARLPYASSTTDGIITAADYGKLNSTDTTLSGGVAGEYLDGDGNWYVLNNTAVGLGNVTNVQQIPLANLDTNIALGTSNTLVSSQNAVKTYVDNTVSTASGNYLLRDGTQAMTGNFNGGANALLNITNATLSSELRLGDLDDSHYVGFKSPDTVGLNYIWKLPAAEGTAGQILSTDGAGNLSWASSGAGSVTNVTATLPLASTGGTTPNLSISQANTTSNGFLSSTDWNAFNNKEPAVAAGTTAQYRRGDKTWQTLNTSVVPEGTNLYYTTTRARTDAVDDAIVDAVTDVAPSQNAVFDALALKANQSSLSNYVLKAGDTMTGLLNLPTNGINVGAGQLIVTGGNVGIGTATPSNNLQIGPNSASYSGNQFVIGDASNNSYALRTATGGTTHFSTGTFSFMPSGPGATGNVGIGTNVPMSPLDVRGSVANVNDWGMITIGDTQTNQSGLSFGFDSTNNWAWIYSRQVNAGSRGLNINNGSIYSSGANGNVGIGTTAPTSKLQVAGGNAQFDLGYGPYWVGNTDLGFITFRSTGDAPGLSYLEIGTRDNSDEPIIFTQTGNERMRIHTNGNLGVGTAAPVDKLHVAGDVRVGTGTTGCVKDADATVIAGTCSSDERFKKDIRELETTGHKLAQLRPVRYFWRKEEFPDKHFGSSEQIGLIAQEVARVFPELVVQDKDGFYRVRYSDLNMFMLQGLVEHQEKLEEIQELKREIASLKEENREIKDWAAKIENENAEQTRDIAVIKKLLEAQRER